MAIVFLRQRKIQKSLILVFVAIILITVIVIWRGLSTEEEVYPQEFFIISRPEIKINFEILENPLLEELQPFYEIEPFEEIISEKGEVKEKIGRENPFLPY